VAGREALVDAAAARLSAPGIGRDAGATSSSVQRLMLQVREDPVRNLRKESSLLNQLPAPASDETNCAIEERSAEPARLLLALCEDHNQSLNSLNWI
jgi:hypothetical protein